MIVMEAFGRALSLEPFFATVVLAGGLLRLGADEAMGAALVPKIAAGDLLLAFAHAERQSRYDLADVATTVRRDGADYILDGAKSLVIHGDCADRLIVSARLAGARRDRDGLDIRGRRRSCRGITPSLSDSRWPARRGGHVVGRASRPDQVLGEPAKRSRLSLRWWMPPSRR